MKNVLLDYCAFFNASKQKRLLSLLLFLLVGSTAFAQTTIKGTVADAEGISLPGVNIMVKGTANGTISDFDGNFAISASETDVLVFKFIGYQTKEVLVGKETNLQVTLDISASDLEEVVVIGYGVQKKALTTGANLNVKGEAIAELTPTTAMESLQGVSPGVNITRNNGQPGAGTKVYIRGIGTNGDSAPLYIVDGVPVGDIDYLNPSDIQSIDVLKDAASAAIYGSRAANGVILVRTKQGKKGTKPQISYDGYYGVQNMYKTVPVLNAQEYMYIMDEGRVNDGLATNDWRALLGDKRYNEVQGGWKGTNWVDEVTSRNAPVQSHSININGGSDRGTYAFGISYFDQKGIVGGDIIDAGLKRLTLRMNSQYTLVKNDDFDIITFGENLTYNNTVNKSVADGDIYWNDLHNAIVQNPFTRVYDSSSDDKYGFSKTLDDLDNTQHNPVALMYYDRNYTWPQSNTLIGNAFLEVQPIKNLKFKSNFGLNSWFGNSRSWIPPRNLGLLENLAVDEVTQSAWQGATLTWTNTVSYNSTFGDHKIGGLLGIENIRRVQAFSMEGSNQDSRFYTPENAYLSNVDKADLTRINLSAVDEKGHAMLSYFGRISYDYKEKYLFMAMFRTDASSNFAGGYRWGYFPSVSAGWVFTSESFMESFSNIIDFGKLRASWGQNGNQAIPPFTYGSNISYDNMYYYFGQDKTVTSTAGYPHRTPNPEVTWETSEQLNIGLDAHFLNSRLQANIDWYNKTTKNWLLEIPTSVMAGAEYPYGNAGKVRNTGVEIALSWRDNIGDFKYDVTASLAHNKNEMVELPGESIIRGKTNVLAQGTSEVYHIQQGSSIGFFYGYETDGVLQNQKEVNAYVGPEGTPYFIDQRPGDVRFVDQNNDGTIDEKDKVELGSPLPDYIFGFQVNAEYKGFYANATFTGQAGMQVMRSYRSFADRFDQNYTTEIFGRWHGEGTSDRLPRLSSSSHRNTNFISDIYMHDADYLRFSNLTIGYKFGNLLKDVKFVREARLYMSVKNLYTFTKYDGMDPEVGYAPDSWGSGIDLGLYPSARTVLFGVSVNF